jgi:ADP-dependent NAD(P)H-hydrate dehydratase / NAD(P)H-hydrate epimerase
VAVLPPWLTPLPDAEQMRAIDRWAIDDRGVPSLDLMERAGTGVAGATERAAGDGRVAVLCGKGNNGGDGLVAARLLRDTGRVVDVICVSEPQELSGDARANLERLPGEGPLRPDGSSWTAKPSKRPAEPYELLGRCAAAVDALLGTGFSGEVRGETGEAIEAINRTGCPVVSVDVPSGVDASSGEVLGAAVRASLTVTFHLGKPGLWINPGKEHSGEVETVDIGIPGAGPVQASIGLIAPSVLERLPRRRASWTKFKSGHVLVVGGSRGLTGAPQMTARASMRAGAGYVTACVPASVQATIAGAGTPELMTRPLPEEDGTLVADGVELVLEASERGGAIALGPGLGRGEGPSGFARLLARSADVPLVLDADGLNAHAGHIRKLRTRDAPTVLTPHAGELARLLDVSGSHIERHRLEHVRAAAASSGAVVLLKGDDTLVADPRGRVAVSPGGTPALATAGTGDVLTGVIAALLAQGLDAFTAAAAGAWLHAQAGREAARRVGGEGGVIATDVIEALPAARVRRRGEAGV